MYQQLTVRWEITEACLGTRGDKVPKVSGDWWHVPNSPHAQLLLCVHLQAVTLVTARPKSLEPEFQRLQSNVRDVAHIPKSQHSRQARGYTMTYVARVTPIPHGPGAQLGGTPRVTLGPQTMPQRSRHQSLKKKAVPPSRALALQLPAVIKCKLSGSAARRPEGGGQPLPRPVPVGEARSQTPYPLTALCALAKAGAWQPDVAENQEDLASSERALAAGPLWSEQGPCSTDKGD
ncbi:hypothetical protein SKAU_G00403280 [Synaphobranchus kaupii]|uniref:Uncharacterized protein n=1 Tax=Synaphobranchus kaupii TaxID=118154 RepID=A0A9Q1E9I7_SYNKA|nr:hypothetical protein SKAU_G00403280 [Synaphobranchus kaupii]